MAKLHIYGSTSYCCILFFLDYPEILRNDIILLAAIPLNGHRCIELRTSCATSIPRLRRTLMVKMKNVDLHSSFSWVSRFYQSQICQVTWVINRQYAWMENHEMKLQFNRNVLNKMSCIDFYNMFSYFYTLWLLNMMIKGYTNFVIMYVTGKRRLWRPHQVYMF